MAVPFYSQADQDIYASGDRFIPQEQYRLGYTPPSTANASTGITNTQVAAPYKWPPEGYYPGAGDGGGGFSNTNKFGLNLDTQKDFRSGVWSTDMSQNPPGMDPMTASYKEVNRPIAQDQSGNWKYVDTNKNVYHANINAKPMFASLLEKATGLDLKGKYGLSDEFTERKLGSTMGYEWDEDEMDIGTRRRVPQNIITRWRENREIKKEQNLKDQIAADNLAAADEIRADQVRQNIQTYGSGDRPNVGLSEPGGGKGQSPTGGDVKGTPFAYGGRIGFNAGGSHKAWLASKGFSDMMIGMSGDEITALFDSVRGTWSKAQGGLIGYFDGGIARLL